AVAVADHPFFVKTGGFFRISRGHSAGSIIDGQFIVLQQFGQIVPKTGWASADIGEDDCDHFFRQIIDGIYVLVQVGYIPGQIDRLLLGVVHFLSPVSIDFIVPILSTKGWYGKCRYILPSSWVTC